MAKCPEACSLLSKCGLPLNGNVLNDLNSYVIHYVYGDVQSPSLDVTVLLYKWKINAED